MKATDVLERCRAGAAEVQQLDQRLNRLLSCGADPATIERDVLKCRHALDERARRLDAEKLAACRIVDMLPDPECCILYRYYVMGQNQGSISTARISRCGRIRRRNAAVWRWWNSWMTAASQRFCLRGILKQRERWANESDCAAGSSGLRRWRAGESGMMGASHFTQRCGAFLLPFFYAPPMPLSLTLSAPCMPHPCTLYAPFPHLECTIGACAMIQAKSDNVVAFGGEAWHTEGSSQILFITAAHGWLSGRTLCCATTKSVRFACVPSKPV